METYNVTLYKDCYFKIPFKNYDIEIIGKKARVLNEFGGVFGMKHKSRLNILHNIGAKCGGGQPSVKYYRLAVNGTNVYFKLYGN